MPDRVEKVARAQPQVEDDAGRIAVVWERDGKDYALTTCDDGSIVFTVSPFSKAVPPVRTTIQALRAALAAAEAETQPVAWQFAVGQTVEKFTGEAIWHGLIVARYQTTKGKRRYVVEVQPQGFQMIAVPEQLRASPPIRDEAEIRRDEREKCARIADNGMLVPPDGGSPTQDECDVAARISTAIRARGER